MNLLIARHVRFEHVKCLVENKKPKAAIVKIIALYLMIDPPDMLMDL